MNWEPIRPPLANWEARWWLLRRAGLITTSCLSSRVGLVLLPTRRRDRLAQADGLPTLAKELIWHKSMTRKSNSITRLSPETSQLSLATSFIDQRTTNRLWAPQIRTLRRALPRLNQYRKRDNPNQCKRTHSSKKLLGHLIRQLLRKQNQSLQYLKEIISLQIRTSLNSPTSWQRSSQRTPSTSLTNKQLPDLASAPLVNWAHSPRRRKRKTNKMTTAQETSVRSR